VDPVITCPKCQYQKTETIPVDQCQFFYQCGGCHAILRPQPGGLLRILFLRIGEMHDCWHDVNIFSFHAK
jgi:hypothetical protein